MCSGRSVTAAEPQATQSIPDPRPAGPGAYQPYPGQPNGSPGARPDRTADGPRSLGEAACVGPTNHTLDWFHLAMRIRHAAQTAKGWPAATPADREEGARLVDAVERTRWRLWHGQVPRALDLIGRVLSGLDAAAEMASPAAAGKLAASLRGLETYVTGQSGLIIDYATARGDGEPISTAATEGAVQWLLHRRMGANQQMRWPPRGAHLMLKVRTAVANGTLAEEHVVAERWAAGRSTRQREASRFWTVSVPERRTRGRNGSAADGRPGPGPGISLHQRPRKPDEALEQHTREFLGRLQYCGCRETSRCA